MNKRLYFILIYLFAGVTAAFAQGSIDSKVEVERSYEGDIMRVAKMPVRTTVNDSIFNFNLDFDYSTFYRPYNDLYELSSAVTATPFVEGRVRHQWLYANISAAYPLSPQADIYISPRFGNRFSLLVSYNHYSYWGNVPYDYRLTDPSTEAPITAEASIPGDRMINRVGMVMAYRWRTGEVTVRGKYSSNFYAYNQSDGLSHKEVRESMSHTFDMVQTALRVRSTNPNPSAFYYDALVRYSYFNQVRSIGDKRQPEAESPVRLHQHAVDWDISLGATFKTYHKVFLNHKYKMTNPYTEADVVTAPGLWSVTPTYRWEKGRWGIDAGLAMSSDYKRQSVMFFPDVYARFAAVPNSLWINAKVKKDYQMYTFYDQASLNPWFDASDYGHVMSDGEVSLGLEGVVRDRFSYTFNVGYRFYENMLTFASDGIYQICNPADAKTGALALDATLKWQSKDVYAGVEAGYRYFSNQDAALMIPAFKLKAVVEYNLKRRFFIAAEVLYHTSSRGLVMLSGGGGDIYRYYRVPGFVDLGARLTYAVNNKCSVYLEGKNLLNQKIQYFLNYYEPGVNVSAGVIFSF